MKYEKLKVAFEDFKLGDLVINEPKDNAYIIYDIRHTGCPCLKVRWIKIRFITGQKYKWYWCEFGNGKRDVMRAV